MHIKLLYRKVLYVFLSVMIVFANTQTAFAASSWNVTSVTSAGSRVVVTATKAGYKSAINIAPTAGRLGLKLVKGANWASLIYAALQLAPPLADIESFQPQYSNNRLKYDTKSEVKTVYYYNDVQYSSESDLCDAIKSKYESYNVTSCSSSALSNTSGTFRIYTYGRTGSNYWEVMGSYFQQSLPSQEKYIPISTLAPQIIKNAAAGHAPSRDAVEQVAAEMVAAGDFDADLLSGAVPINDTKPLIPSVPISGNGNQGYGGVGANDGSDGGMSGATPGQQADAAKDAAEKAKNSAAAAKDAAKDAAEQAAKEAGKAKDVINSGADQAAIAAAEAKAKAAEKAAADAKAVADAAIGAANDRAAAAEKAAEAATKSAADAATKAASDLAAAKAAGDAAAIAAAEAAKAAADTAVASAKEKQAAAEKAAEKAKAEAAKPFELPAFCTWAAVVCDYMSWVKEEYKTTKEWVKEEPTASPAELMPIDDDSGGIGDIFKDQANAGYVSFQSECPANVLIPVSLMGASQVLNISYAGFCHFASLIRPAVILGAWISGLLIISGGRARE